MSSSAPATTVTTATNPAPAAPDAPLARTPSRPNHVRKLLKRKSVDAAAAATAPPATSAAAAVPEPVPEAATAPAAPATEAQDADAAKGEQPNGKVPVVDRLRLLRKKKPDFPPTSWTEEENAERAPRTSAEAQAEPAAKTQEVEEPAQSDAAIVTSPNALAKQIYSLLSSVPPFYHGATTAELPKEGSAPLDDAKILALLSSPSVMNGSQSKGKPSVWTVLDRVGPQSSSGIVGDNSIMLCAPLHITPDTEVEIARSETVKIDVSDLDDEVMKKGGFSANWWPFGRKKETTPAPEKPKQIKEVRVWIPSKTKISIQCSWWGFRIWLPPPVLKVLDDKTLEATKRAALVTTALKWILDNVPASALPPPMVIALSILRGIVPIIGYIGGFIAWSWSTIKSFDRGKGVTLSATWLLPIALLPGDWQEPEIPAEDPPATPAPAPAPTPAPAPAPTDPAPTKPPVDNTPIGTSPPPPPPPRVPASDSPILPPSTGDPTTAPEVQPVQETPAEAPSSGGGGLLSRWRSITRK